MDSGIFDCALVDKMPYWLVLPGDQSTKVLQLWTRNGYGNQLRRPSPANAPCWTIRVSGITAAQVIFNHYSVKLSVLRGHIQVISEAKEGAQPPVPGYLGLTVASDCHVHINSKLRNTTSFNPGTRF